MSITELLFKYRIRVILFLIIIILALLVFSAFSRKVLLISPFPGAVNVDPGTPVTITFNGTVNPQTFQLSFNPKLDYTQTFENKNTKVVIHPNVPMSVNTKYTITISNPIHFQSTFSTIYVKDYAGQSAGYRQSFKQSIISQQQAIEKGNQIGLFRNTLPQDKPTFSVSYRIEDDSYLVRLKGDQNKAEQDFLAWLKTQEISPGDITIVYVNADLPTFAPISTNFDNQTISPTQKLIISFTTPINREIFDLTTNPDMPIIYDFSNGYLKVILTPLHGWPLNATYTLTLHGDSQDEQGNKLGRDYTYTFSTYKSMGGI